ncbi:MAG TPA: TonB-dependent receptor plug domain-containing protein, partial [Dongiaceae bacterium]|nr:TonB-dependent receptor plug domain-containing protein [Dongiaceae bacterium]
MPIVLGNPAAQHAASSHGRRRTLLALAIASFIALPVHAEEAATTDKSAAEKKTAETKTSADANAAQAATPVLTPVDVHADQHTDEPFINQERPAKVGKTSVPVQDTPASITVVDKQFIQDTGAKNIQDALLYSSGVYSGQFGFDTRGDWTSVRGLAVSKYQDGLRSIYGFYNAPRTEVYMLDSIEVLKGPSSVLYGQAELGGIINAVSKLPEETQKGEVWAQVG